MKLKKVLEERYKQLAILLILVATIIILVIASTANKPEELPLVGYTINDNSFIEIKHKKKRLINTTRSGLISTKKRKRINV